MEFLERWKSLTWDDLALWAGDQSVSRGREYQRAGQVEDLAISENGNLSATVLGGDCYLVVVWLQPKSKKREIIESSCTCPMGNGRCKHAVAVIASYLDMVAQNKPVPVTNPKASRSEEFQKGVGGNDGPEDQNDNEERPSEKSAKSAMRARSESRQEWDARIRAHIEAKSRKELADLVWTLIRRFPDLHQEFRERLALADGDTGRLLKQARQELRRVTAQPGWSNNWSGESSIPDYSGLVRRLERLIESGHADAVAELGEEIIERGMAQINQSDDEGETASAFAECVAVVFQAVAESSLPPLRKLLFLIDTELEDQFGVTDGVDVDLMEDDFDPAVWSEVADELARRLNAGPERRSNEELSRTWERDRLSSWLANALNKAGREDEVFAVYEREAPITGSYERLVTFLMEEKRYEDAELRACEGIKHTAKKYPGIASNLLNTLAELAKQRGQWDVVAAHVARQFFESPTPDSFMKLAEAAGRAGCEEKVREFALRFLETGVVPAQEPAGSEWPLPQPDYFSPMLKQANHYRAGRPHYNVLIDMAIAANQPEDVLKWYDLMCAEQKSAQPLFGFDRYSDRVAEAVEESYPQRSLDIYHRQVKENLAHANQTAYRAVVSYLRRMRPLLKWLDREQEWRQTLADIRLRHRNRPKLMELLSGLDNRTILETQKEKK